jgi:hypothetical protein
MRTNESFYYEPDKLAEGLIGEFDIDEGFDIGGIGSGGVMIAGSRTSVRECKLSGSGFRCLS